MHLKKREERQLQFITVSGSDREIGRQHAEAFLDEMREGMPKFYWDFWNQFMQPSKSLGWVFDRLILRRLFSNIPTEFKERLQGMADVLGEPPNRLSLLFALPDIFPMFQSFAAKWVPEWFVEVQPPMLGCSSFVAKGSHFLHSRNLDFPGVNYWDRFPVVSVYKRPGRLNYIGFSSAGIPIPGITGINEAQISVSLHQNYAKPISFSGKQPFVVGEEILGRARDLKSALEIIQKNRVATAWTFIVADGKTQDAFVAETHAKAQGVRWLGAQGTLAQTNYFQCTECKPQEYATTARMNWDNHLRQRRMMELVVGAGKDLSARSATKIACDHFDLFWKEEKVLNRTLGQAYNIQSLVYDLGEMKTWCAVGLSPIQLGEYVEIDLGAVFSGRPALTGNKEPAKPFSDPKKEAAKRAYIQSFIAAFDNNVPLAIEGALRSLTSDFCPEVAQVCGVMLMKSGEYERARELFEQGRAHLERKMKEKGKTSAPPEYFELMICLARAYDLLQRNADARAIYKLIASRPDFEDVHLKKVAVKAEKFTAKKLKNILLPYSAYIPFR